MAARVTTLLTALQLRIGDVDIETWPLVQQVFVFKVLCIIHRLEPRWEFERVEGPNIGVRLTLYGYTVVVQPSNGTTDEVGVRACRHALFQMQDLNPEWLVPPMPEDGLAGPEWDWVMLLEGERVTPQIPLSSKVTVADFAICLDYCVLNGERQPVYSPFAVGELAWHCDVRVDDRLFHTAVASLYMWQARNTVAHLALCKLVVTSGVVAVNREAVDYDPTPQSQTSSARQQLADPVIKEEDEGTHLEMPGGLAGPSGPSMNRDRMEALRQHEATAGRKRRPPNPPGFVGLAKKTGANKVPLSNDRLSRLQGGIAKEEPAEGRLVDRGPAGDEQIPKGRAAPTGAVKRGSGGGNNGKAHKHDVAMLVLKRLQTRLRSMSSDVPYTYMLTRKCPLSGNHWTLTNPLIPYIDFCSVLNMAEPEIRIEKHPSDPRPGALAFRAHFDETNAYLHSLSPMTLCYTSAGNEEKDRDLAVQRVILTLVENARTNVGIPFPSDTYHRHAKYLQELEAMLFENLYGKGIPPENTS